jgi:hypothetical protein
MEIFERQIPDRAAFERNGSGIRILIRGCILRGDKSARRGIAVDSKRPLRPAHD